MEYKQGTLANMKEEHVYCSTSNKTTTVYRTSEKVNEFNNVHNANEL